MIKLYILAGGALSLLLAGGAGAATNFGPASGAIAILGAPTVTLGAGSGTESYGSLAAIFAATGSLSSASGFGSVSGTLDFSNTVGSTVSNVIPDFLTFTDTSGGQFDFNVSSVETMAYSSQPGVSTSIGLYLLGTAGDANLGLTQAPTSVTLTVNQTGASAYSASASIAAPPAGAVPEPAVWGSMLVGFGLIGTSLRRRGVKSSPSVPHTI